MIGNEIRLSRDVLYRLVWSQPLSKIAPRLGLSDVGLAKICDRLKVPRPRAGYWIKNRDGTASPPRSLPPRDDSIPPFILVSPTPQARTSIEPPPSVPVPTRLTRAHPLVRDTKAALQTDTMDPFGRLVPLGERYLAVKVGPKSKRRALLIMEGLIRALELRGHRVEVRRDGRVLETAAVVKDEAVEFRLREKVNRTQQSSGAGDYSIARRFNYAPSGRLCLEISALGSGYPKTRGDRATRPLEKYLGRFILDLETAASEQSKMHLKQQAQRLRDEARRREELRTEQLQRRGDERVDQLKTLARDWRNAQDIREFLTAAKERSSSTVAPKERLEWAWNVAKDLDPVEDLSKLKWS